MTRVLFEIVAEDSGASALVTALRDQIKTLNKELKGVNPGAEGYAELVNKLSDTKVQLGEVVDRQKALNREFKATQVPKDSLAGLRLEYAKTVDEIAKLSKAQRESAAGKALQQQAANYKAEINSIQESVGNFVGNVGNYKGGILAASQAMGGFNGTLGEQAALLDTARGVFSGVTQAAGEYNETIKNNVARAREVLASTREYIVGLQAQRKAAAAAKVANQENADAVGEGAEVAGDAAEAFTEGGRGVSFMSTAGKALRAVLASLGIGLIIVAITALLGVFKKFAPVVDFVERAVDGLAAAFDVLVGRAARIVGAIGKIFSGDFKGGFRDIGNAVSGMGGAMYDAATAAAELRKQMQDLEDAQKDYVLQNARAEAAVARLNVALKDRTKGDRERLTIADQLTKIETDNLKAKTDLINRELEIERKKLLLSGQITEEQSKQITDGNFDLARQLEDEYKLQLDQADRIRDLLVQRATLEGDSATLLERVQNRRNQILDASADRRKAADEKQQQALAQQLKRITDLEQSIRTLETEALTNTFDQQFAEIANARLAALDKVEERRRALEAKVKGQGGKQTGNDQREATLIEQETEAIKVAYDRQADVVTKAREAARDKALADLRTASNEVAQLAAENAQRIAELDSAEANAGFDTQLRQAQQRLATEALANRTALNDREITRAEFDKRAISAQETFNREAARIERERLAFVQQNADQVRQAKELSAAAALRSELEAIEQAKQADLDALRARGTAEGVDVNDLIAQREIAALEARTAAQQKYAEAVKTATKEATDAQVAALEKVNDKDAEVAEDKTDRMDDEKEKRRELQDFLVGAASTLAAAVFNIERERIDQQRDTAITALDAEYGKRIEKAKHNKKEQERLQKELESKKAEIEREAARKRKSVAIKEAIIQGALAVVKALPNYFAAAAAAIATAAQIAVINAQTFARGGFTGRGGKRDHTGRRVAGIVHEDEYVAPTSQIQRYPKLFGFLENDRRRFLKPFAAGGFTSVTPQLAATSATNAATNGGSTLAMFTDQQTATLATILAREIAAATGNRVEDAMSKGLTNANRDLEREKALTAARTF